MRKFWRKPLPDLAAAIPYSTDTDTRSNSELLKFARSLQKETNDLGKQAAQVNGSLQDSVKIAANQSKELSELAQHLSGVQQAQESIRNESENTLISMQLAKSTVEQVSSEISHIQTSLSEVLDASKNITKIALQTRIVAFNASIEATHAGPAGRGFNIVANAVKDLADKVDISSKEIMRTVDSLHHRIDALAKEIQVSSDNSMHVSIFHQSLAAMERSMSTVIKAAKQSGTISSGVNKQMQQVNTVVNQMGATLTGLLSGTELFLQTSEHLMEIIADCGVITDDTQYIQAAQNTAREIQDRMEQSLQSGEISEKDLFDENYQAITGTNPEQFTTRFIKLADKLFPPLQEQVLRMSDKVVFCITVDRNGYVATHNQQYSHPQRAGDVAWNTANSRYRRIFNDRTGLAAAKNERPFLLQTYRRDMGGGRFVLLKEVSAPIRINGRHWGGLRLAYHF